MNINIKGLYKSYENRPIFENLNMQFSSEKPTCIMGSSGIGKTTLMSIILGIATPDKGTVEITDGDIFSAVFQEDRLCEELSAMMNVAITANKTDANLIINNFKILGLEEENLRRPVKELSGGQRRRVAILRAIMAESDGIIMDEPFKGLDVDTKQAVTAFITNNLNGRLLLVITHDKADAKLLNANVVDFPLRPQYL